MLPTKSDVGNQPQPTGEPEPSTPTTSGSGGQPIPEYVQTILSRLDEQDKFIRGVQKGADKQIGQVKGEIKRILELGGKGLDESQIERELLIDRMLTTQTAPQATHAPDKSTGSNGLDMGNIDQALELPANDPRVTNLKLQYGNDPVSYLREGMKLKGQLSTQPPTPAEMPLPGGGKPPAANKAAEIETGYLADMAKVRRGDTHMAANIKAKWRAIARENGLQLNV